LHSGDKDLLVCLASGKPATDAVARDLLSYVNCGKKAAEEFVQKRLIKQEILFHDPVHKLKLQTFASKLTSSEKKTV